MDEHNKMAVVTGAGSGIGRATAIALLGDGYSVALVGRRREPLDETAAMAESAAARVLVVPGDVGNVKDVRAIFEQARQTFGRLDLLFNNAGINVPPVPIEELTVEQWQSVVDVNLTGAFLCTQAAFRLMKSQSPMGGRIINNGSISAHVPRPNSAPYTSTKHAITGLTKSIALDGRKYNIACGQIDIGNAETPLAAKMKNGVPQPDGSIKAEPTFDVEHVARAVVQMANLPLDANILSMTIMATNMPFVGRG
ncbi:MAG: SDR family oxidoreductase [Planctomycetota bacterium]|nr:SDR family oxidoreductase [Planctomycetota bacterium]